MALPASLLAGMLWQGVGGLSGFGASAPFVAGAVLSLIAVGLFALRWQGSGLRAVAFLRLDIRDFRQRSVELARLPRLARSVR